VILPRRYPNPAITNTQKTKKLIVLIDKIPPKRTIFIPLISIIHLCSSLCKECGFLENTAI